MDYRISGERLKGFADQVRRISGVEGELTPEQMETNLLNVTPLGEYPKAENSAFGVANDSKEYGFATVGSVVDGSSNRTFGYKFTVGEAVDLLGFRITGVGMSNPASVALWDSDGNVVTKQSIKWTSGIWTEFILDTPITLAIGGTYTFGLSGTFTDRLDSATFNGKLTNVQTVHNGTQGLSVPTIATERFPSADIIIGAVSGKLPDDYQIQRTTMDDIAKEVQRISGATTKLSTAQIITGLSGVAGGGLASNEKKYQFADIESGVDASKIILETAISAVLQEV